MKQIYYVIQALIHGRSSNIRKVISLGSEMCIRDRAWA